MTVYAGDGKDAFFFSVDSMTCTTVFAGIEKNEPASRLPDTFLPKIVFEFFSKTGAEITTEMYDEKSELWSISRNIRNMNVCLQASYKQDNDIYLLKIN